jgi:integrase
MRQAQTAWNWARELNMIGVDWPKLPRQLEVKGSKTTKRPYTDKEVYSILEWSKGYMDGRWEPVLTLLADTGARVGAVLGLRERDLQRNQNPTVTFRSQWLGKDEGGWRPLKTKGTRTMGLPEETMRLLTAPNKHGLRFPNYRFPKRPAAPESVRDVLKKAIIASGIKDPENLDTHSFRRAWVTTADRAKISTGIAMRVTGHKDVKVFHAYQQNAQGDDLGAAVKAVRDIRKQAGEQARACLPHVSPKLEGESLIYADQTVAHDLTLKSLDQPPNPEETRDLPNAVGETCRGNARQSGERRMSIWGRLDPDIENIARWAD